MASKLVGAIVGTFKVGTGVKVGQPVFQPDKPQLKLNGKSFVVNVISGDFKVVTPGKAQMKLAAKVYVFTTTYTLAIPHAPILTLNAKVFRAVEPDKQRPGKAKVTLKAKSFVLNKSASIQVGKAKMTLRGGAITKAGKAGLVPLVPTEVYNSPSVPRPALLVPTSSYTGLLTPTRVENV